MAKEISQAAIKKAIDEEQIEVKSWADFHSRVARMTDTAWIFRGVSAPNHYPQPSIGREAQYGHYKLAQEQRLFRAFKDRALSLVKGDRLDDWQWLAYAQHVGVPTRLLDWTTSPMVAAFFAICEEGNTDRLLYCVKYSTYIYEVDALNISPFDNRILGRFSPPMLFDRLKWQRGLFTIHPDPTKIFYRNDMRVIRIPANMVESFRKKLFKYGIDYWHIYPDFEGLGKQLRWQYKNKVGLGSLFLSRPR
jgi:hypothetical protein